MADDDGFESDDLGGIEDPDGYAVASAAGELSTIAGGAKVLKAASAVAAALWILAIVTNFWSWWDITKNDNTGGLTTGAVQNSRILQVLSTTLQSTWGYLLVAVVAYAGAMLLHGQRMRLLVAAMSDDN